MRGRQGGGGQESCDQPRATLQGTTRFWHCACAQRLASRFDITKQLRPWDSCQRIHDASRCLLVLTQDSIVPFEDRLVVVLDLKLLLLLLRSLKGSPAGSQTGFDRGRLRDELLTSMTAS